MERTTLMLPGDLKHRAEEEARKRGLSMGAFIRHSLEQELGRKPPSSKEDSFFKDKELSTADVPGNDSLEYENEIYGKNP